MYVGEMMDRRTLPKDDRVQIKGILNDASSGDSSSQNILFRGQEFRINYAFQIIEVTETKKRKDMLLIVQ